MIILKVTNKRKKQKIKKINNRKRANKKNLHLIISSGDIDLHTLTNFCKSLKIKGKILIKTLIFSHKENFVFFF